VTTGAVMVAVSTILRCLGGDLRARLAALVSDGLSLAMYSRPDPGEAAVRIGWAGAAILAPILATALLAAIAVGITRSALARRRSGHTAVPLPPGRSPGATEAILSLAAAALIFVVALRIFVFHFADLTGLTAAPGEGTSFVPRMFLGLLTASGAILILAGTAQSAVRRVRVMADLGLSRSEAAHEERAATGDRRVRGEARAAARGGGTGES